MSNEQGNSPAKSNGNGSGIPPGQSERAFMLQQLYVKDVSFEAPNSPQIFQSSGIEPETELNLRNAHSGFGDDLYEVVLHISVHAKKEEKTIFLAEIDQAGLFLVRGYDQDQISALLGTQCPATLFPYAREAISSLVTKGGFPPLILQPINFEALYAQAREQQSAQS
jgi:preprotein translocase subunit SecB